MTTIKSYTDLSQSKKLAEILPLESTDMHWQYIEEDNGQLQWFCFPKDFSINQHNMVSAWSLTALLGVMICPKLEEYIEGVWDLIAFTDNTLKTPIEIQDCKDPIDACYEMILKLNELNLL